SRRVGPRSPWSASPANSWAWDWSSLPRRPRRRRRRLPGSGASGASAFGCSCCWPPACGAWPAAAGAPCWPLPPARSPSPAAAPPPAAAAGSGAPASPPSSSSHSDGGSSSGPAAGAAEDAAASSPAGSGRSTPAFGPRASSSPPSPPPWAAGSPAACSPRPAVRRDPVRDDEDRPPDASPAGSTPVSSRMSWMISALRARDGGLAPRAWAIVTSSSRSLRSRADRSRALGSTLIGGCHLTAGWGGAGSVAVRRQRPCGGDTGVRGASDAGVEPTPPSGGMGGLLDMLRHIGDPPENASDSSAAPRAAKHTATGVGRVSAGQEAAQHLVAGDGRAPRRRRFAVHPAGPVDLAVDEQVGHGPAGVRAQLDRRRVVGQQQEPPGTEVVEPLDEAGEDAPVPRLQRRHLGLEVAGVARLVGGLDVEQEDVGAVGQRAQGGVPLALVVGVVPAGRPRHLDDLEAGEHAEAADEVDGRDQRALPAGDLAERRQVRPAPLAPQPHLVGGQLRGP